MPYRLKKGIYLVRCRHPGCSFHTQMPIEQNIMGMTELDVELEAKNLARDMGATKHDAIFGTKHPLRNPEIRKVSGSYELIGLSQGYVEPQAPDAPYREYGKGEIILKKGDGATAVCEVVRGSAYPERNKAHRYGVGDCFGASALLARHNRTCNVVAASDGTRIAFYNLIELGKHNPLKANRLFEAVMEDTLKVIRDLEHSIDRTRKEIERETVRG